MPYIAALRDYEGLLSTSRGRQFLEVALVSIAAFVLIDRFVVHPFIWENHPTAFYFAIKPLFVGVGLVSVAWLLMVRLGRSQWAAVLVGGFVGVVYLQLYYTLYPIPLVSGEEVQIGLLGNLTGGLLTHFGAFALGLVFIYVVYTRVWAGDS